MMAAGCSYAKEEPGLFSQRQTESHSPEPAPAPEPPKPEPPEPTNPQLPVLGRQTWVSADGLNVQVQLAVHAVRRIPGATVLDWSVTPVRAPGLSFGDRLSSGVSLGLTRETRGDVNALLVDAGRGKVYRPLRHRIARQYYRCLCSPVWAAQFNLRLGETRLLQIAYPPLPAELSHVDVNLTTLPPFVHVPVSEVGEVPTARQPTDLTRAPGRRPLASGPIRFSYPRHQTQRELSISINQILASPRHTSLQWTVTSLTEQGAFTLLPPDPPLSAELKPSSSAVSPNAANGPRLAPTGGPGPVLRAQWMSDNYNDLGFVECLCTELGLWATALREPGGQVMLTTNYPPLPAGTTGVDVLLSGVGRVPGLAVTPAPDSAQQSGGSVVARPKQPWTYQGDNPPRGWSTSDWPTPLPAAAQVAEYDATVEDLVASPR